MSKLCHICKHPENQRGSITCSAGVHLAVPPVILNLVSELTVKSKRTQRLDMAEAEFAIFFDIDGCFHPMNSAVHTRSGELHPSSKPLYIWADGFLKIIEPYHNVALVCHSMWRLIMGEGGVYWSLPPLMQERFLTCTHEMDRYGSILKTANDFGFQKYIIVDDSPNEFPKRLDHFIECDSRTGLSCPITLAGLQALLLKHFGPPPPPKLD